MPFRFKKSESPTKAVRRVCRERVGAALNCLRRPGRPAAVHGARKEIKKLRAIFRLVRGEIGAGAYRKNMKALRAAADCLATTRDARVMLKAFEKLTGSLARKFTGIKTALQENARREARQFRKKNSVAQAELLLRKTGRRVNGSKMKATGWGAMEPGLKQSYQQGREASRLARTQPGPENFHEWRKHVKDLWYYFGLLQAVLPAATRAMTDQLELLGEQLGEDHDLFLLQEFTAKHCAARAMEVESVNRLIASRQKKLRAAAVKFGSRFYAETPARFCRRLVDCAGNQRRAGRALEIS